MISLAGWPKHVKFSVSLPLPIQAIASSLVAFDMTVTLALSYMRLMRIEPFSPWLPIGLCYILPGHCKHRGTLLLTSPMLTHYLHGHPLLSGGAQSSHISNAVTQRGAVVTADATRAT